MLDAGKPTFRAFFLVALIIVEFIAIIVTHQVPDISGHLNPEGTGGGFAAQVFHFSKEISRIGLSIAFVCILLASPRLHEIFQQWKVQSRWWFYYLLVSHLIVFGFFALITSLTFDPSTSPSRLSATWLAAWLTLLAATILTWLCALAPPRFWLDVVRKEHIAVLLSIPLGLLAWRMIRFDGLLAAPEPWTLLAKPTLDIVRSILSWIYTDLVYQPEAFIVGTNDFVVEIRYGCSGIEGIALATLFIGVYFWLFRKTLRFPQALCLLPLGIVTIWITNSFRIAMLIVIGTSYSRDVASQGFHAQAGWVALTLVAVSTIILSHQLKFFAKRGQELLITWSAAPALVAPLLALLATSMLTSLFSSDLDMLYPFRVAIVGAVLFYFKRSYTSLGWRCSWQAVAIGAAVFVIWLLLEPLDDGGGDAAGDALAELPAWGMFGWIVFRVIGSVVIVPLAEELAFRAYLIRKLSGRRFDNWPLGTFSGLAFVVSSVLFGLMHHSWIAGTLAGMGYALALRRRGQFGDAVVAHMATNALIAVTVLTQGRWSLWS